VQVVPNCFLPARSVLHVPPVLEEELPQQAEVTDHKGRQKCRPFHSMEQEHGRSNPGPTRHPYCLCGVEGIRSEKWEAYYCPTSGVWLESKCQDPKCQWCPHRPEKNENPV